MQFEHVVCDAGVVPIAPRLNVCYTMVGVEEHWFRFDVRLAVDSKRSNGNRRETVINCWPNQQGNNATAGTHYCGGACFVAAPGS